MNKFLKYTLIAFLFGVPSIILIGYLMDARIHYSDNPLALDWNNEGPYIFLKNDSTFEVNYIKGSIAKGFYKDQKEHPIDSLMSETCYFPLDSSSFDFTIQKQFLSPKSTYNDGKMILAISDIESNYKSFRDFLIHSKVIDKNLNWIFGDNHLVLVGDFVDRGYFTTQVLWFIYKLEQDAARNGGVVHYIIGNHELKMMHGNYSSTDPKYDQIASILGKKQIELYSSNSIIGKWMSSKNAMEIINGNLFVHGGIHPDFAHTKYNMDEVNHIIRHNYFKSYDPQNSLPEEEIVLSHKTGPCWYRGYFKDGLTQKQVDLGLDKFGAKSVIVGHTIQTKVNRNFNGKVIAIDVQHPNDDHKLWPEGKSEALLIEGNRYYRVFANGIKEEI